MAIISNILKGACIGIANIIPGVSGGTMALVLGIYERLISAIRNLGPSTAMKLLRGLTLKKDARSDALEELKRIDALFMIGIVGGAGLAIVAASGVIIGLLENYHDPTYAFFCGLIAMSIYAPIKLMSRFGAREGIAIVVALCMTVALAIAMSGERLVEKAQEKEALRAESAAPSLDDTAVASATITDDAAEFDVAHLSYLFVCGAISMSAMILPGVSGSFLLLMFGVYFEIIRSIRTCAHAAAALVSGGELDVPVSDMVALAIFGMGCIVGLLGFARLLSALLKRHHDTMMAFLIGLMAGSIYGIWPFQEHTVVADKRIDMGATMPAMDADLLFSVFAFAAGCVIIYLFQRREKPDEAMAA